MASNDQALDEMDDWYTDDGIEKETIYGGDL